MSRPAAMIDDAIEQLADAVLYEGYNLYPYRPSALKNRYRWLFGCVFPKCWCEAHAGSECWNLQTQCLVAAGPRSLVDVAVRFLRPAVGDPEEHRIAGTYRIAELLDRDAVMPVDLSANEERGCEHDDPAATISVTCDRCSVAEDVFRLTVRVENRAHVPNAPSVTRDDVLPSSLVSLQALLRVHGGEFLSSIDPPERFRDAAGACENVGLWPVLVGDRTRPSAMLAAPIILDDFPQLAPESPGDLFDGTEIDELLSLRIQTLTDAEKSEAAAADLRTRELLRRTESLDEQRWETLHNGRTDVAFHSAKRGANAERRTFRPGDRVRLRPRRRADAFDLLLDGRTAVIAAVERDLEDNVHLAVTIDDDPGRDFGAQGMPGHRFFFHPDEVERIDEPADHAHDQIHENQPPGACPRFASDTTRRASPPRILIAGIGNVFKGDDGFGVEVARALAGVEFPSDVAVADFGIRGVDLAFAITAGCQTAILVDAMQHGGEPGQLSVIQPGENDRRGPAAAVQGHNLDPLSVLRWASAMTDALPDVYVVGCEPAVIPDEDELLEGLSPAVRTAVPRAVELIRELAGKAPDG